MQNNPPSEPNGPMYTREPYPLQQPPYPPMMTPPSPPPPKKRRTWLWILLGAVAVLVLGCVGIVAIATSASQTGTTPQATSAPAGNTPAATQPPAATPTPTHTLTWTTVQSFKGSGSKKTQTFTVGDNWRLKWTCDPASFSGIAFNVIIEVDNADGSYADLPVNTTCKPGNTSDVSYEAAGGTYLLSITSEGDWTIQVQTQQ